MTPIRAAKKAVVRICHSGVAARVPTSYDCNIFRPGIDAEDFFGLGRLESCSQRELVEQPSKTAYAAKLNSAGYRENSETLS
jgi:hypothetical protein